MNREFTDDDNVDVTLGNTVILRLSQVASTGYRWKVAAVGDGLTVESETDVAEAGSAPGAAGAHVVRVRADEIGSWLIQFVLARSWEGEPVDQRTITVTVR